MRTTKALARLRLCAVSPELLLVAYVISTIFSCIGSSIVYIPNRSTSHFGGLCGLVVNALDFQAGYFGFESRSGRDNFQTTSTPSSYSTCFGLSIKRTGRRLVSESGTKRAWVIHESKAVLIHVHYNRRCLGCLGALKIRTITTPHFVKINYARTGI